MNKIIQLLFFGISQLLLSFGLIQGYFFYPKDREPIELKIETIDINQTGSEGKIGLNERDESGENPLMIAAENGDYLLLKVLIKAGADVNSKDNQGSTALMKSTFFMRIPATKVLLENGADPNVQNNYGATALLWPTWKMNVPLVNLLIKAGADPRIKRLDGSTAISTLDEANKFREKDYRQIKDLFSKAISSLHEPK